MKIQPRHWFNIFALLATLLLVAGCPSDPGTTDFNDGDDAGHPSDDVDDNSNDGDADADEDIDCTVPGDTSLTDAIDDGCTQITVDDDVESAGEALTIDYGVTITGESRFELEVPADGLFVVDGGDAALDLENLDLTRNDDADGDSAAVISVLDGSLTTTDVTVDGFVDPGETLLELDGQNGNVQADLESTSISGNSGSLAQGSLAIGCTDADVTLGDGSSIDGNNVEVGPGYEVEDNQTVQTAIISVDGCDLTVDDSSISGNGFDITHPGVDGQALYATDSAIEVLNGSAVDDNAVAIDLDTVGRDLDLRGAGFDLLTTELFVEDSTVSGNQLDVIVGNYDTDTRNEFGVSVRGAGVFGEEGEIDMSDAAISNNTLQLGISNEDDRAYIDVDLAGAGININNSASTLHQATLEGNDIGIDLDGTLDSSSSDITLAQGAGIANRSTDGDDSEIELAHSTLSANSINVDDTTDFANPTAYGAGLSFDSDGQAQLQMVNTTVSGNEIFDAHRALGAGVYVAAPGFEEPEDGDEDDGDILPWLLQSAPVGLSATFRYSTIADNHIESATTGRGAGLYVDALPPTDSDTAAEPDRGPAMSFIGFLIADNMIDDDERDCNGKASAGPMGDDSSSDDAEWGSGHNLVRNVFGCGDVFPNSGADEWFSQGNPELAPLDDSDGNWPTPVHVPAADSSDAVDAGENSSQCSTITPGDHLDVDQRGEVRPGEDDETCDIGAVEL